MEELKNLIMSKIKELKDNADRKCIEAYQETPEPYKKYITTSVIEEKIFPIQTVDTYELLKDPELIKEGVFEKDGWFYCAIQNVYMKADGRILWFNQEHKDVSKKYEYSVDVLEVMKKAAVKVILKSEIYGQLVGISDIDSTGFNVYSSALTNAIAKAIALTGKGVFGTGVACAEEMLKIAYAKEETQQKLVLKSGNQLPASKEWFKGDVSVISPTSLKEGKDGTYLSVKVNYQGNLFTLGVKDYEGLIVEFNNVFTIEGMKFVENGQTYVWVSKIFPLGSQELGEEEINTYDIDISKIITDESKQER